MPEVPTSFINRLLVVGLLLSSIIVSNSCGGRASNVKTLSANRADTSNRNSNELIDINSASKTQLVSLPGIGEIHAQEIIDGRPYREKLDLVRRNILSQKTYDEISDRIIARQH